jgi:hypothetical protein
MEPSQDITAGVAGINLVQVDAATSTSTPIKQDIQAEETPKDKVPNGQNPRLRYKKPYWWPYKTFVKER